MNIHVNTGGFFPDAGMTAVLRIMRRGDWYYAPYGWWTEASGDHVVFDRGYHPICHVRERVVVEIVEPDTWIEFVAQQWFSNASARRCAETRRIVSGVIARLGIAEEIKRRRKIGRLLPKAERRPGRKSR